MTENTNLRREFDFDGDKMTHVRKTPHGVFRAVVTRDEYPEAPYDEMGCPVFRITHNYYGGSTLEDRNRPELGEDSWRHDGIPHDMSEIWDRMEKLPQTGWTTTIDLVDRYLRIFHDGGAKLISSNAYQSGDDYLTYDTRAMREYWGMTGARAGASNPEASEWQAYIDNEVYVVSVERADAFDEDDEPICWETVDGPVGGFYGKDVAFEEGMDMLEREIDYIAGEMLPLEI